MPQNPSRPNSSLWHSIDFSLTVKVSFSFQGDERRLPASIELALYRIAQEALSNVSRHAHATQATLSIGFDHDALTLQVIDNGLGFQVPNTPSEFAPLGHFGLLGLYEGSDLIGASLKISSEIGIFAAGINIVG